jgi:hypothetical protein
MHRVQIAAVALVAGSISATAVATSSTRPSATSVRPSLSVRASSPIVVYGRHFVPHERVRITTSTGAAVTTRANTAGAFSATLVRTLIDRCTGLRIRAVGSHGTVAALKLPLPACLLDRSASTA